MSIRHSGRARTTVVLVSATAALATGVALAATAPAWAADEGRIYRIESRGSALTIVFGPSTAAAGQSIAPASVRVTLNGTEVPSVASRISSTTGAGRRSVLVMDTSGSMQGAAMVQAKRAANAYLAAVPKDVAVGLVSFADAATLLVAPTTDRAAVATKLNALQPVGATALYDGVILGVKAAGTDATRNLLLLSDGADEGSKATLPQAVAAVKGAGVTLDAVSLGTTASQQLPPLQALAAAGGGRVITATQATSLAKAFQDVAATVSSQVQVVADVPPELSGSTASVVVSGAIAGSTISAQAAVALGAASPATQAPAPPQPVETGGLIVPGWSIWVALGALFVGLVGILLIAFGGGSNDETRGRVRRRLQRWSLAPRQSEAPVSDPSGSTVGGSTVARSAVEFANRFSRARGYDSDLARRLDASGVPLKSGEWILIHVGVTVGLGIVFLLLSGFSLIAAILGLVIGLAAPYLFLSIKESRRRAEFSDALPNTLTLLAGSLSAGYSLPQAVDAVARESHGIMASEMNRAIVEARLGVPLEEALDGIAERMRSDDFSWVVMAIRVQREVGGNLSEVLTNVATTMRERERLRRQVRALSAEGRLSAVILALLPIGFAAYLALVRPDYLGLLFSRPLGIAMVVLGLGLLIAGIAWLRKVVTVEV